MSSALSHGSRHGPDRARHLKGLLKCGFTQRPFYCFSCSCRRLAQLPKITLQILKITNTPRIIIKRKRIRNPAKIFSNMQKMNKKGRRRTSGSNSSMTMKYSLFFSATDWKFAPYIGVSWIRKLGETADFAEEEGEDTSVFSVLAGVRFWF